MVWRWWHLRTGKIMLWCAGMGHGVIRLHQGELRRDCLMSAKCLKHTEVSNFPAFRAECVAKDDSDLCEELDEQNCKSPEHQDVCTWLIQ